MEYFKANRAVLEHALFEDESNPSIILPMPNKIASNATGEYLVATAGNYDIIKNVVFFIIIFLLITIL